MECVPRLTSGLSNLIRAWLGETQSNEAQSLRVGTVVAVPLTQVEVQLLVALESCGRRPMQVQTSAGVLFCIFGSMMTCRAFFVAFYSVRSSRSAAAERSGPPLMR